MATTVELYSADGHGAIDVFVDYVYLTLRKEGTITLSQETYGEDPDTGKNRYFKMLESIYRIRTPEQLIKELKAYQEDARYEFDANKLIDVLKELDPAWASKTREYLQTTI